MRSKPETPKWQVEADLLADGRETLERLCDSWRLRHLYPEGPDLSLLLFAYQELDRRRAVGLAGKGPRRDRRMLRRILREAVHRDALARNRRLVHHLPQPRVRAMPTVPPLVEQALMNVDHDVRARVLAMLKSASDRAHEEPGGSTTVMAVHGRGLAQFRDALLQAALSHPSAIPTLHPQIVGMVASAQPVVRRHPIATLLFVKIPLNLVMLVITLLNLAYVGAYYFFNDEVLGKFVSTKVSAIIEGDLEIESIHWSGRLILDLVTGQPHHCVVKGVTVYEPYKSYGGERERVAAHADHIEASLVLHEIIPWNRLAIPAIFDIPWVLHFGDVDVQSDIDFSVRGYMDTNAEGTQVRMIGLRDAFRLYKKFPLDRRGLSFQVDHAHLNRTAIDVDFREISTWRFFADTHEADFALRFTAPDPLGPVPEALRLQFTLDAKGGQGAISIDDIDVPLDGIESLAAKGGVVDVPYGDVAFDARTLAAGSDVHVHGKLVRALARELDPAKEPLPMGSIVVWGPNPTVELDAATRDIGELLAHVRDELELPPYSLAGEGAPATARIEGPLLDPIYHLAAEGLVIDPLDEPAWAIDDAEVSVHMTREEVPEAFGRHYPAGERMVATFDTFSGSALDGSIALAHRGREAQAILPLFDDEPFVLAADLDLRAVNPGQLTPDDRDTAATLAGVATGVVSVEELVLGPVEAPSPVAAGDAVTRGLVLGAFGFHSLKYVRDRGPEVDHIPKSLRVDGRVTIDETGAIDFDDLLVSIDGGKLRADGGVNGERTALADTALALDVDDGRAFTRALGLPDYIQELHTSIELFGPLSAPSGRGGHLSVQTTGGGLPLPTEATMRLDRGVLHLETDNARLLGGQGEVEVALHLFEKGGVSDDPRMRARVALQGVDLGELTEGQLAGSVDLELEIGDGEGGPARFSDLRVTGTAASPRVRYGGTTYHDVRLAFRWTAEELAIEQLTAALRRSTSPSRGATASVETGRITAEGTVGMQSDPALDLRVSVVGVPLDVVGDLLDMEELPVRGQIGAGTRLDVGGTLARPAVDGKVALVGLSGMGIPLGSGQLDVTSEDVDASSSLQPHRELRARGELSTGARGRGRIDWSIDAVVALGRSPKKKAKVPVAAQVDVTFARLSVPLVLRATEADIEDVDGALEGLSAHVLTCNPGAPLLSDCTDHARDEPQSLSVKLALDRAWLRAGEHQHHKGVDPCTIPGTLCTDGGLQATVEGTSVRLDAPLRLRSPEGTAAELAGSFDLSPGSAKAEKAASSCRPPPPPSKADASLPDAPSGGAHATLRGRVALQSVKAILQAAGVEAKGAIEMDLAIDGPVANAHVSGRLHGQSDGALVVFIKKLGFTVEVDDLAVKIDDGWVSARGKVRALGETLWFGAVSGARTGYAFAGPCAGTFEVAADGTLGARAIAQLVGTKLQGARGGVRLRDAVARGRVTPELTIERAQGRLVFEDDGFTVDLAEGLEPLTIEDGVIEVEICGPAHPCRRPPRSADARYTELQGEDRSAPYADGTIALYVGGKTTAGARPRSPLKAEMGRRGRAELSGALFVDPKTSTIVDTSLQLALNDVFYRDYDPRGRPVAEAEVTSRRLAFEGADPIVVKGSVTLARGRYVKDAIEGADILAFTDKVELPEAPPPDLIRTMQFDLEVKTDDPLRVENNIATGVEATMAVSVSGSYDAPELQGRLDVEAGGKVDLPFVTGTFEIQRGRVQLVGAVEDSEVSVIAMREEPIYVEDQARELQLVLGGTLSGITWSCLTDGDTSDSSQTQRSCFDYLVLGTGDVQVSKAEVRRFGGGGLGEARKPLQIVGHVTELDLDARAEKAVPRLRGYIPEMGMRLGQIGPELHVATPRTWFDFGYGRAGVDWDYTRGYPGFFLRQSRQLTFKVELLGPITLEFSRRIRSYLNQRVVFDPLQQNTLELRFDVSVPSR